MSAQSIGIISKLDRIFSVYCFNSHLVAGRPKKYSLTERFLVTGALFLLFSAFKYISVNDLRDYETICNFMDIYSKDQKWGNIFKSDAKARAEFKTIVLGVYDIIERGGNSVSRQFYDSFETIDEIISNTTFTVKNQQTCLAKINNNSSSRVAIQLILRHFLYLIDRSTALKFTDKLDLVCRASLNVIYTLSIGASRAYRSSNSKNKVQMVGREQLARKVDLISRDLFKNLPYSCKLDLVRIQRRLNICVNSQMNTPSNLDIDVDCISSSARTPLHFASMIAMIFFQSGLVDSFIKSRRGGIVKENLELIIAFMGGFSLLMYDFYKLYWLEYARPIEKLYTVFVNISALGTGILIQTWSSNISLIPPWLIGVLASSNSSIFLEFSKAIAEVKTRKDLLWFLLPWIWLTILFVAQIIVYSLDLVLVLRHEQFSGLVEKNKMKLLQNTKSLIFLSLFKGLLIRLFSGVAERDSTGRLQFILENALGGSYSIIGMIQKKKFAALIFSLISTNLILITINYLLTSYYLEAKAVEAQAEELAKHKRTLLNCTGGYNSTLEELHKFYKSHSLKNTILLLVFYNLGNLTRLPYFGNGCNMLSVCDAFLNLRTQVQTQLRVEDYHILAVEYPAYYKK